MNILGQSVKVRRHMAMLTIVLLILSPFALFATLLLAAAFSSGSPPDGFWNGMMLVGLLITPALILVAGVVLLARMRAGFTPSTRRRLFGFYVCLLAYCGIWLAGSGTHGGNRFTIFDLPSVLAICLIVATPAFVTMFTTQESEQAAAGDGDKPAN